MEKNQEVITEKEKGALGAALTGSAIGGPVGGLVGVGMNKLWNWGLNKYKNKDKKSKTSNPENQNQQKNTKDQIKNIISTGGIYEPETYQLHKFYLTTIYDKENPDDNNFLYVGSQKTGGGNAYKDFINYWIEQYKEKYPTAREEKIKEFTKLIKERFKSIPNRAVLITVPQYYKIDSTNVIDMAKNSDEKEKTNVIYNTVDDFDLNYALDLQTSRARSENKITEENDKHKISLIILGAYGREYNYAFDFVPGVKDPQKEAENVMVDLGQELTNDAEDTLYAFTRICEQFVDNEKIMTNKYTVAAPLLRKNTTKAQDMEYNALLLDGVGIYDSEEEFKKNYLEDYCKLMNNKMGI